MLIGLFFNAVRTVPKTSASISRSRCLRLISDQKPPNYKTSLPEKSSVSLFRFTCLLIVANIWLI